MSFVSNVCLQWRIQDFPEEGAPTPQGGRQHTILPIFPENCMKLKEFGPPGGGTRPKFYYVDPPLAWDRVPRCFAEEGYTPLLTTLLSCGTSVILGPSPKEKKIYKFE